MPDPYRLLDCASPLDWSCELTRGRKLLGAWAVPPLSGWWGGKTFRDLTRGGKRPFDATLANVTWTGDRDRPGGYGCLSFNGTNSQGIIDDGTGTVGTNFALTTVGITHMAWVRTTSTATQTVTRMGDAPSTPYVSHGISIASLVAKGYVGLNSGGNAVEGLYSVDIGTLTSGRWHHVAYTWDGSTLRGYLDGRPTNTQATATAIVTTNNRVTLGYSIQFGEYLSGLLDDVVICKCALPATYIAALRNDSRRGHPEMWRWVGNRTWYVPVSANVYSLAAGSGSYALTGTAAALTVQHKLAVGSGTLTLTGQPVSLTAQRRIAAAAGTYSLSGTNVTLTATTAAAYPFWALEAVRRKRRRSLQLASQ